MSSSPPPIVTLLTDYGLTDVFVGLCHAAVLAVEPRARIIDLCHAVPPQDVRTGALLLADCLPALPPAVHVAVVDPGVGTARRGIAIAAGDHTFVGPDNGLLWPAAARAGGITGAWELSDVQYHRPTVSRTFHGRDIFAPVAGHLAAGVPPQHLGPALDPERLCRIDLAAATVTPGQVSCEVVAVDRFGNLQLSASGDDLRQAGWARGTILAGTIEGGAVAVTVAQTFADVPPETLGLLEDSFGHVALFLNGGHAAQRLGVSLGAQVSLASGAAPSGGR